MIELKVGQKIKLVPTHWLRPNSYGVIEETYEDGRYLISFAKKGLGFDQGTKLILDEKDFNMIED